MGVTPLFLDIAMTFYWSGAPHEELGKKLKTEPGKQALQFLFESGMIENFGGVGNDCSYVGTEKLSVWINYILETPFPETKFYIPNRSALNKEGE